MTQYLTSCNSRPTALCLLVVIDFDEIKAQTPNLSAQIVQFPTHPSNTLEHPLQSPPFLKYTRALKIHWNLSKFSPLYVYSAYDLIPSSKKKRKEKTDALKKPLVPPSLQISLPYHGFIPILNASRHEPCGGLSRDPSPKRKREKFQAFETIAVCVLIRLFCMIYFPPDAPQTYASLYCFIGLSLCVPQENLPFNAPLSRTRAPGLRLSIKLLSASASYHSLPPDLS